MDYSDSRKSQTSYQDVDFNFALSGGENGGRAVP